jgi:hypothetical protein
MVPELLSIRTDWVTLIAIYNALFTVFAESGILERQFLAYKRINVLIWRKSFFLVNRKTR